MGYRSDVGYVIRFKDIDEMQAFVAVHAINEHTRAALEECAVFIGSSDDTPELHFLSEDTKWYDSFESVQAHQAMLDFIDDDCPVVAGYKFIRIGEEDDDTEQKVGGDDDYIPWDALYLNRAIRWDGSSLIKSDKGTIAIVSEAHSGQTTNS